MAIETEIGYLLSTGSRCIDAGKHIHLDKPAGESLPQFQRLLADAARQGLTVQMGYMFRYNSAFQFCLRAVAAGWLGEIFSIEAVISRKLTVEQRRKLIKYKGGSVFELGCHMIDQVMQIAGRPQRVTSYARHTSPLRDGVADNMLAVLEYDRCIPQ